MLLKYLCTHTGAPYISDLKYSDGWRAVLLQMDRQVCESFSIHDWQEALLYLKQEPLGSSHYQDYLQRLLE